MAISSGVYMLVSALDATSLLDCEGSVRGSSLSNIQAWEESNNVRFAVQVLTGTTCAIGHVATGLGVRVNAIEAGSTLTIWDADTTADEQRFTFTQVTTASYHGATCDVCTITPESDSSLYLDSGSVWWETGTTGLQLAEQATSTEGIQSQRWILYPTYAVDSSLPIPYITGWATTLGGNGSFEQDSTTKLYPVWGGGGSWGDSTPNGWQVSYRAQELDSNSGTWGDWGTWTDWTTASTTRVDNMWWLTSGIPATLSAGTKGKRYQFLVRAIATINGVTYIGYRMTSTLTANFVPTATASNASFGPLGLSFDVATNYSDGTNFVSFVVYRDGVQITQDTAVQFEFVGSGDTVFIPLDYLREWLDDGDEIDVTYYVSTDTFLRTWNLGTAYTTTLTVAYDAGHGVTLDPSVTMGTGRMLQVDVDSSLANEAVYVRAGGKLIQAKANGDGTFSTLYPFNADFELYCVAYSNDMSSWGTWEDDYTPQSSILKAYPACHAWSWDGGSFLLEVTSDIMATDRKIDTTNEIVTLDSREYQSVLFSKTLESRYTAKGVLKHGLTESDKGQLLALLGVKHAYYRAPHGDVANVAITGVSYVDRRSFTEVSIDMVQVSN